jgi:prepilin-type N-terminal cleavage/methylation domain-containing protein
METSRYRAATTSLTRLARKRSLGKGFSLLEVLIAIAVLVIGLSAMAALVAQSLSGTENARFMALATTLASEKLEDLNRWPSVSSYVAAGGSLTSDAAAGGLNYFDDVSTSNTSGQVAESTAVTGGYSTIIHQASGVVTVNPTSSTSVAGGSGTGTITFHRRWLIESGPTVGTVSVTGARRVTVLVTLTNQSSVGPPISFQMSMIRP